MLLDGICFFVHLAVCQRRPWRGVSCFVRVSNVPFARHHCDRHGFAVAMGCSAQVGYAVGAIFDFAKALLPVALLLLLARRAFLFIAA